MGEFARRLSYPFIPPPGAVDDDHATNFPVPARARIIALAHVAVVAAKLHSLGLQTVVCHDDPRLRSVDKSHIIIAGIERPAQPRSPTPYKVTLTLAPTAPS